MNEKLDNPDVSAANDRISQIDHAITELRSRQINRVSAISEENKELDDSGTEAAEDQVNLGLIRQEIEELERERAKLEEELRRNQ